MADTQAIPTPDGTAPNADFIPEGRPDLVARGMVDVGELIGCFDGFFTQATMKPNGDMAVTVGVPYEDKYRAMPITDERGVLFTIVVFKKRWEDDEDGERLDHVERL